MQKWATSNGVEIDDSCYFLKKSVKDWAGLKMSTGSSTARFGSVDKGMTLQACQSMTADEVEDKRKWEEAL